MLGNGRLEAMCFDGVKRLCHIRGKLRKKVWINQSDIILVRYLRNNFSCLFVWKCLFHSHQVGLRDYQDTKADVILKYSADEARNLKSYGEFPETVKINETVTFGEDGIDDDIEFDDVESSEEEGDGLGQGIDDIWAVSAAPETNNFKHPGLCCRRRRDLMSLPISYEQSSTQICNSCYPMKLIKILKARLVIFILRDIQVLFFASLYFLVS